MNFNDRVTMRDIARVVGVHQSTISLALRNDRSIPEATRERIRKVCSELGYRPHPYLSMLGSVRKSRRYSDQGAVLAYVVPSDNPREIKNDHASGAREAAEKQGYLLEEFVVGKAGVTPRRLNEILLARNIQGMIIAPFPEAHGHFDMQWEQFCTVVVEYTFTQPAFDAIVHDNYSSMRLVMQKCRERKLSRVGLIHHSTTDARTEGLITAAYWYEQKIDSFFAPIPHLVLNEKEMPAGEMERWCKKYKPQAIVTTFPSQVLRLAQKLRLKVPDQLSIISFNTLGRRSFTGIDQKYEEIGATAMHLLMDKIHRNERGIPTHRKWTLVPGEWYEGRTLKNSALLRKRKSR